MIRDTCKHMYLLIFKLDRFNDDWAIRSEFVCVVILCIFDNLNYYLPNIYSFKLSFLFVFSAQYYV